VGDRFVCIRADSNKGRSESGAQAIRNIGREEQMREELSGAVADVVENIDPAKTYDLTADEQKTILDAADIVTLARTAGRLPHERVASTLRHKPKMLCLNLTAFDPATNSTGMTLTNDRQFDILLI
jgi:hypothetical protein